MNKIRVLTAAGSPFDRGSLHGKTYADEIEKLTDERLTLSTDPYWTGRPSTYTEIMSLGKACLDHHQSFSPDLMEELRGIAETTGIDLVELLIMNGFTDFIDVVYNSPNNDPGGCTAFIIDRSISYDKRGYLGQTWDMHPTATPHVILLNVQPDNSPALLTFTLTGCLGMIGMNEYGIAVGINNISATDGRPGVTWPFVIRKMLAQTTVEAALNVLLDAHLAGAHNYLLLGPDGVGYNIEAMATRNKVTPVLDYFVHTNHCLIPALSLLERPRTTVARESTTTRIKQANKFIRDHIGQITPGTLMDLTRYREGDGFSVCTYAHPEYRVESSGACIMSPSTGELWAVWGLPDQNPYQHFVVEKEKVIVRDN